MANPATLNFATWQALFPALPWVTQPQAQLWYNIAGEFYLRNDGTSDVTQDAVQADLMNLATAHLCALFVPNPAAGAPQTGLVGRISNASEGSVSVTAEYAANTSSSMAWWVQTPYGAAFWQATNAYRRFMPVPGPQRNFGGAPWFPWGGGIYG